MNLFRFPAVGRIGAVMRWAVVAVFAAMLAATATCVVGSGVSAAERPSAERLLPDHTVAMLSVPSVPQLTERFLNSAIGKMSQDPQLRPVMAALYGSLSDLVGEAKDRVGLSLGEMLALPQGEVTVALVAPPDRPPALIVVLDVKEQAANARTLLEKGAAAMEAAEAEKTEEEVGETKITAFQTRRGRQRTAAFFEKDNCVVLGSDVEVLKGVLARWGGEKAETLADNFNFNSIMNRCRADKSMPPQVIWYADPIALLKAAGSGNAGMAVALALLPSLGLDGLLGIGGTFAFDVGPYDYLVRTHLLLQSPREGVLKMIDFKPVESTPERWAPRDIASYRTLSWDMQSSFRTLSTVYDSFTSSGALSRELSNRILGPTGIDFEKEILPHLEGRITVVSRIAKPITMASTQQLLAVKLRETQPIEDALAKLVEKFPERLAWKEYAGKKYVRVDVPEPPPRGRGRPRPAGAGGADEPRPAESPRPEPPPRPEPCVAVLDGYLIVVDREALFEQVVVTLAEGKSLADELDYKLMVSRLRRQSGDSSPAMISFGRPEEGMRTLYELAQSENARSGLQRRAARNRFWQSVDTALNENPLPPFAVLEKYLSPQGGLMFDDESGLHYVSFALRRAAEATGTAPVSPASAPAAAPAAAPPQTTTPAAPR